MIASKDNDALFCYHLTRLPFADAGKDVVQRFARMATRAVLEFREALLVLNSQKQLDGEACFRIEQTPCGHLTARQQTWLCSALLAAMHQRGFQPENMLLEHMLHHCLYSDFCIAMDEGGHRKQDWMALAAAFDATNCDWVDAEGPVGQWGQEWGNWEFLFWDCDWEIFELAPVDVSDAIKELSVFEHYKVECCLPDYDIDEDVCEAAAVEAVEPPQQKAEVSYPPLEPGAGFVYCIAEQSGKLKVGITSRNPTDRLRALQTANPEVLEVCMAIKHRQPKLIERRLHQELEPYRLAGEWFRCSQDKVRSLFRSITDIEWASEGVLQ